MNIYKSYLQTPFCVVEITANDNFLVSVSLIKENPVDSANYKPNEITILTSQQLTDYFEGKLKQFKLPIKQEGTAFQQKVWNQLCNINYGKTISYKTLAIQLGDVKCIRAAGTANGKNNIAIIVPCHRVIGSNGSLVGYAGGLPRKQWLLEHEAKFASGVQSLF